MYNAKVEVVYPFTKTIKVISWYQKNNPARQKFKNPLEPEGGNFFSDENRELDEPDLIENFKHKEAFSPEDINRFFAAITIILRDVLKSSLRSEELCFLYRYFTPDFAELVRDPKARQEAEREYQRQGANSFQAIGDRLGFSDKTAAHKCYIIQDRLTRRFCERKLLNPHKLQDLLHYPDKYIN
jgi:hypothetical protein